MPRRRSLPQTAEWRLSGGVRGAVVEWWPSRLGTGNVWPAVRARRTWRGRTTSTTPSAAPQRASTPPPPAVRAPMTPASDATCPRTGADRPRGDSGPTSWCLGGEAGRVGRCRVRTLCLEFEGSGYERATYPTNTRRSLKGELGGRDSTSAPSLDPLLPRVGLLHEGRGLLAEGCAYCTKTPPTCSTPDPPSVAPHPRAVHAERHRSVYERLRPPGPI